jgi:hypothetical protein
MKKVRRRGYLEWQYLPTKFHENPPIGSKVISGHRQTDRHTQAGDLISPLSFFESRLKMHVGGIFCDLAKAINCVNREFLLSKLHF